MISDTLYYLPSLVCPEPHSQAADPFPHFATGGVLREIRMILALFKIDMSSAPEYLPSFSRVRLPIRSLSSRSRSRQELIDGVHGMHRVH